MDKVSAELASRLEAAGEDCVIEVVVELEAPNGHPPVERADRQAAIAAMQESFRVVAEPVEQAILSSGGEITGRAWINRTLRARLPASCLQRIVDEQGVTAVDVPKPLEPEAA